MEISEYTDAVWICPCKFLQISIYWRNQPGEICKSDFRQYTKRPAYDTGTSKTTFDNYKGYVFENPSNNFYPDEKVIFNGKLDKLGKATASVELPSRKNLPGTLSIGFVTKVYEPGGRFSINQKKFKYRRNNFNLFLKTHFIMTSLFSIF